MKTAVSARAAPGHRRAQRTEVDKRRVVHGIEQNVSGLDIAMLEACVVDLLQAVEQRPQDAVEFRGAKLADFADVLTERLTT